MPWKGYSSFGLLACLLVHLLLADVISGADAPVLGQDAAEVIKASCRLVIHGHSAGDVRPLPYLMDVFMTDAEREDLNSKLVLLFNSTVPSPAEVSLSCTPPDVVSVMVPKDS